MGLGGRTAILHFVPCNPLLNDTHGNPANRFIHRPLAKFRWAGACQPPTLSELWKPFGVARPDTTKLDADNAATLAKIFKVAKTDRVEDNLETLASLGQARVVNHTQFVAS